MDKGAQIKRTGCLSAGCHDDYLEKKIVHDPIGKGTCESCHKALTDEHPNEDMLDFYADGKELCLGCHYKIIKLKDTVKVTHEPFMKGVCVLCHTLHSSDFQGLIKEKEGDLCYSCHEDQGRWRRAKKAVHTPVKDGMCSKCHNPHGSDNRLMLIKPYPEQYTMPFKAENFSLCFECHTRNMALLPTTGGATEFRNGYKNLHFIHVNNEVKGRSCRTCHDVHASDQSMQIVERTMVNRAIPIKFIKTETGGSCETGCHKKRLYDRLDFN